MRPDLPCPQSLHADSSPMSDQPLLRLLVVTDCQTLSFGAAREVAGDMVILDLQGSASPGPCTLRESPAGDLVVFREEALSVYGPEVRICRIPGGDMVRARCITSSTTQSRRALRVLPLITISPCAGAKGLSRRAWIQGTQLQPRLPRGMCHRL